MCVCVCVCERNQMKNTNTAVRRDSRCNLCNINLTSKKIADEHNAGKKHQKKEKNSNYISVCVLFKSSTHSIAGMFTLPTDAPPSKSLITSPSDADMTVPSFVMSFVFCRENS